MSHLQAKPLHYTKYAADVVMMPMGDDDRADLDAGVLEGIAEVVVILGLLSVSGVD